jgi:hypothetical protein
MNPISPDPNAVETPPEPRRGRTGLRRRAWAIALVTAAIVALFGGGYAAAQMPSHGSPSTIGSHCH